MSESESIHDLVLASTARIPSPGDPTFVLAERRADLDTESETYFGDDRWPLSHIDHSDTKDSQTIDFSTVPEWARHAVKVYIWNCLNTYPVVADIGTRRLISAPSSVLSDFRRFRSFVEWLTARGVEQMDAVTPGIMSAYARRIARTDVKVASKGLHLLALSRIWMHNDGLPGVLALCRPPWFGQSFEPWLGPAEQGEANRTQPIPPDVMQPLLAACICVIDTYLNGSLRLGNDTRFWEARRWAHSNGLLANLRYDALDPAVLERWKVETNWVPNHEPGDVRAAALILIGYLTGMRPQELLHVQRHCLRVSERGSAGPDNGVSAKRYEIFGTVFKGVVEDGVARTQGSDRQQPWVTIEPAARAVAAMRQLSPGPDDGLLFALLGSVQPSREPRQRSGDALTTQVARLSIARFIERWNLRADPSQGRAPIPMYEIAHEWEEGGVVFKEATQEPPISLSRLRRTMAWHIFNQPGGEIALGVQYGHMRTVTGMGYAGRPESGFPDELEYDRLLVTWNQMEAMAEELGGGSAVSGPAANRLLDGLSAFNDRFRGAVLTEAQLARWAKSGVTVYDNRDAACACVYAPATALCQQRTLLPIVDMTPSLNACDKRCSNRALLDSHVAQKRDEQQRLEDEIPVLPEVLADRNRVAIANIQSEIDRHERGTEAMQ